MQNIVLYLAVQEDIVKATILEYEKVVAIIS